jgi:ABC-type glycerol-3-phosphate transport system permease component
MAVALFAIMPVAVVVGLAMRRLAAGIRAGNDAASEMQERGMLLK